MDLIRFIIEFIVHIDQYLVMILQEYGVWVYGILFLIIFCETGLVVTPFLPGDSLLFAAGALAAEGGMNVILLMFLLIVAAILGDTVNYSIGSYVGLKAFKPGNRVLKPEYMEQTQRFYAKHGGKTIVLARFVPIVRTYAPFVAGAGRMHYPTFLFYNAAGAVVWILIFTIGGFLFGGIPAVQENFGLVIIAIILVSVLPIAFEFVRARRISREAAEALAVAAPER